MSGYSGSEAGYTKHVQDRIVITAGASKRRVKTCPTALRCVVYAVGQSSKPTVAAPATASCSGVPSNVKHCRPGLGHDAGALLGLAGGYWGHRLHCLTARCVLSS